MKTRQPGETLPQFAIRVAWEYGHFWSPENPEGLNVREADLKTLTLKDDVVIRALMSLSKMDATRYTKASLEEMNKSPDFNGEFSPAMAAFVQQGRCPIPDYAPPAGVHCTYSDPNLQEVIYRMQADFAQPAFGSGNWKGCHGIGNFHCAIVKVNQAGLPSFLKPVFLEVLKRVQQAYAEVGLLFRFTSLEGQDLITGDNVGSQSNTNMSFVSSSDGWIGLAILGNNQGCQDTIWCRFLNTYQGGSTPEAIITQWVTLIKHELGHNCGRNHTNGGVMNPSLVNGLPTLWVPGDPSTSWLKSQFGGVPVPIPGGGPSPGPTPNPPDDIQKQLDALRLKNIVQDVTIDWLVQRERNRT